jgi:hypothetical protein
MRALREQLGNVAALLVLVAVTVVVGGYILTSSACASRSSRRPRAARRRVLDRAGAHAGPGPDRARLRVKIGDIADVQLQDGRAVVALDIDPEFDDMVREDATALLRPKTG